MGLTLAAYTLQCQQNLHDATFQFWSQTDLTGYINRARTQLCADAQLNRTLYSISVNAQQEQYTFGGVTGMTVTNGGSNYTAPTITIGAPPTGGTQATVSSVNLSSGVITSVVTTPGSGYTSNPTVSISDATGTGAVLTATVLPQTIAGVVNFTIFWGNLRVVLRRYPWTWFNAWVRAWLQQLSRPAAWAMYGTQTVFLGPVPDTTYAAEVDCSVTPPSLVNTTDVDGVLQAQFSEPVCFYACYLAKLKEQSYIEAEKFLDMYKQSGRAAVRQFMPFNAGAVYDNA